MPHSQPAARGVPAELGRQVDEFCRHDESAPVETRTVGKGAVMTEPETHTLDAPGAVVLHYDVRSTDRYSHTAGI